MLAGVYHPGGAGEASAAPRSERRLLGADSVSGAALLPAPRAHPAPPAGRVLYCLPARPPLLPARLPARALPSDDQRPCEHVARLSARPARAPPARLIAI